MASAESSEPSGTDALQFDHAEYTTPAPAAVTCRVCQRPIDDVYYEVNQAVLCDQCRQGVEAHFRGGSKLGRLLKACLLGVPAALAGTVIIYLVRTKLHISAGIISILVGYMVGTSVRKGSGNRGGLAYQFLAVFLTYSAVAWNYIPDVVEGFSQMARNPPGNAKADPAKGGPGARAKGGQAAPGKIADAGPKNANDAGAGRAKANPGQLAVAVVVVGSVVLAISYVALFFGLPQNFITVLIVFFGLQQAWRLTRQVALTVNGPFRVGEGGPPHTEVFANA